ncbi:sodium channel protein Nach-like [Chelonus insularis]|uniref:sodium channel protein Nach-like n=1 Tax=Chelonus insularis TaxID=460826 RepID=UPI00158E7A32|nr:sodium channel protein Nach-like [Chelonus insularis]
MKTTNKVENNNIAWEKMVTSDDKLKTIKKKAKKCWNPLKRYMANSSLHGVPFLVEDGRHWTEILFWLVACALSWYGCGTTVADTITDFLTRKTAITMDTNYLNWEATFPAIHFCFGFTVRAKEYSAKVTNTPVRKAGTMSRLSQWVKLGYDESIQYPVSSEDYVNIRKNYVPNCDDIFGVCKWNGEPIDCCKIFFPLHSNLGGCLSFNSIHAGKPTDPNLPKFIMTHQQPYGRLTIFLNNTNFWVPSRSFLNTLLTDPLEYPTQTGGRETFLSAQWNHPKPRVWDITQIPTFNDDGVISALMSERRCRLSKETEGLFLLKHYNYQGCMMEAQMDKFYEFCGCVGHVYPASNKYRTCNQTELTNCITGVREDIVNAKNSECLPDCEQTRILSFENSIEDFDTPEWAVVKLEFNLLPGPTVRYYRYTVVSLLDVIVTVGGTLGLFVGASVLSLVEIPYWFFLRNDDD